MLVPSISANRRTRLREQTPNLHLMIPFVRTRWELEACLEAIDARPLGRQRGLHRWVMAEVPSVAYRIPEYAALGVDGVLIGSNDLTQLVLGVDRDSEIWCSPGDRPRGAPAAARARPAHLTPARPGAVPQRTPSTSATSSGNGFASTSPGAYSCAT